MNGERRTAWAWLPWLGAAAAFVATLQTADDVLGVPPTTTPLVAAAAAVPLGLITTVPALGWLLSAGAALVVSRAFDVTDGDPWPWPTVHGVVLLALVFATAFQPLPGGRRATGALAMLIPAIATIATAFLFAFSVPDDLRAGWTAGAALVGVAGIVTARLQLFPTLPAGAPVPPGDLPHLLRGGLRRAATDWGPAPATTEPSPVAPWVRRFVPWLAAFVIFWTAIATIEASVDIHPLLVPVAGLAIALPAGLVDRNPLIGWRLATVIGVVLVLLGPPAGGEYDGAWPVIFQWTWLATVFFVAVRYDRWTTICVWAVTVAAMTTGSGHNAGTSVTLIVAVTAVAVIGDLVRARRSTSRDLERQTELSELEKARRTVLEERSRLARDLHDVVAHHMSMVVVQAETAPYRLRDLPDDARAEFASIGGSARQALDEIRGLLGVLRGTDDGVALAPQPGVDQLADLVGGARRSGVAVELTTAGAPPPSLSAAVGLSAYRIVQESLANAVRHAPGTEVTVDVRYTETAIELRIRNAPPRPGGVSGAGADAASRAAGSGHGLLGMRERAAVVGGTLSAGPAGTGGFAVDAVLPYRAAAAEAPTDVTTEEPTA
ncbi:sensor histidine kinase [Jiangella ureilytica]|uniref:sensor histidine kinase n=1 Tax=Jiangella ureilytica TaxID=2530374 RepID=UPI00193DACFA|nr:histidine kinase [Jiangella ureilytica]